jgi:outer membrane protein OmpA-like peptidoglycan-associated protein
MAELHVQPKRNKWIWIILALILLAILFFVLRGRDKDETASEPDQTEVIATTEPDYANVDLNAPAARYDEITDAGIVVQENDNYTIYGLGDNILFGTDNSNIEPGAAARLEQIAASVNKRFKNAKVAVYGRADATGTEEHNKELGAQRATSVSDWLVSNGGIDRSKISVHSLGELKPVATNTTEAGMQENRSVQIVVFKK